MRFLLTIRLLIIAQCLFSAKLFACFLRRICHFEVLRVYLNIARMLLHLILSRPIIILLLTRLILILLRVFILLHLGPTIQTEVQQEEYDSGEAAENGTGRVRFQDKLHLMLKFHKAC